jgi:ubiquinone/menaquinone biosynthesis C-methylase UbiE
VEKDLGIIWKTQQLAIGQNEVVQKELLDVRGKTPKPHYSWKSLAKALNEIPGKEIKLIDVGCGGGYMVEVIDRLLPGKFNYTGADFSDHMLSLARQNYQNTEYLQLDVRDIDLPDLSYDAVMSCAVLVHVPEWKQAIKELCRISKKYLVLHNTPTTTDEYYSETRPSYGGVEILFQRLNLEQIGKLTVEAGFKETYRKKTNDSPNNFHYTLIFERK